MLEEKVQAYLQKLIPARSPEIVELEELAEQQQVPIMDGVGMEFLLQQLRLVRPKRILEIGTAIGYSAIRMALVLPEAEIVTIERDEERYKQAVERIEKLNLNSRINILYGDALHIAGTLESVPDFDALFIDAAKSQYQQFFETFSQKINAGGVIFSDNVLFRGWVADRQAGPKRWQTIVKNLRSYNEWLMANERFNTTIVPIGDGLAISIKR